MSRTQEEIYNDVYYKKFEAVWSRLAKRRKPIAKIVKRIENLANVMVKNNPDHRDRIDECIRTLAETIAKVAYELKKQADSQLKERKTA